MSGRSPGEENGHSLQYSCPENTVDRGAWWATVHGIAELDSSMHAQAQAAYSCGARGFAALPVKKKKILGGGAKMVEE